MSQAWEVSYDDGETWESLGVNATGENGADGKTPYIGSNGNWWMFLTITAQAGLR